MERVLEQKVRKVVEGRTDTPAMLEALQAIAAFYGHREGGNTAEARKSLRQDLEKQNMVLCDRFLELFEVLQKRLAVLDAHTANLEGHCQGIHARIETAEESMSAFLARAHALKKQQADAEAKAAQITSFLDRFTLSDAEVAALRFEAVDKIIEGGQRPFFAAMTRVQEIRAGCGALVGSPQQSAGFEMLEALSEHQEAAFRRLHSWILQRCAGLERDDAAGDVEENDVALGLGLRTMRGRSALFVHCQECLLQRRKDVVRRRFLQALSGAGLGGSGESGGRREGRSLSGSGGQRPIEMQAHDPVRYLSDILAWLHQTVASEKEFLQNLLGAGAGEGGDKEKDEISASLSSSSVKQEMTQLEMLAGIMEGVAPLLKARIMHLVEPRSFTNSSVSSSNQLILSFRLLNLLAFYDVTLQTLGLGGSSKTTTIDSSSGTTPSSSAFGQVLRDTRAQAHHFFEAGLRQLGEAAMASPPAYPIDLSAADLTKDAGRQLTEILWVHESSLIPTEELGYEVDEVLTALVEPVLRACRLGAEGLDPSDAAVYMLNNAGMLYTCLVGSNSSSSSSGGCVGKWVERLKAEMETWLALMVKYQSEAVLERTGLGPLLERAVAVAASSSGTLSATAGLDAGTVGEVMKGFYQGLFSSPQFEKLDDPRMRARARQRTSKVIAEGHETAYKLFSKGENGYPEAGKFLIHTPEQVRILLDCEEEEEEEEEGIERRSEEE